MVLVKAANTCAMPRRKSAVEALLLPGRFEGRDQTTDAPCSMHCSPLLLQKRAATREVEGGGGTHPLTL